MAYFCSRIEIKLYNIIKHAIRNYSMGAVDECNIYKGLIIGLYEREEEPRIEPKLSSVGERFDHRHHGRLSELIHESGLIGRLGKGKVFNNIDPEYRSVAVVGLGREGIGYNELEAIDEGMENARIAAAIGTRHLDRQGCTHIYVDPMEYPEQAAEGSALAVWKSQDNKRKTDRKSCPKLDLFESPEIDAWTRGLFKADAQNLARRLCETPANQMTPTHFAQATVDCLCPCGINVEVRGLDWIESQNMSSFLSVARSSCEQPVFLEINYCGGKSDEKPILLIGKGLTFNSGGLCLKDGYGMDEYRASMSGAACVVATIRAAAALSLPINVSAVIPLCENMPSGMAFKPGDVITCLNGKTIAVHDTNNAGLLIMADTFTYGQITYKPKLIIDVATLSEGIRSGLSGAATGVFSNSHFIWKQMHKAGALSGDRVWKMPLWNYFTKKVTDYTYVDLSNKGHGKGSPCLAAAFLNEFVIASDWIHLDSRGVGMLTEGTTSAYLTKNQMTGRPTRTLIQFLYQMACPDEQIRELKNT